MDVNLPPSWSWVKLGDVCEIVMGQSPPSSTYNTDQIGLPFFQGKAEFTEIYPEVRKWCSEPKKIAKPLDILVSVRAPVGSTNIANKKCCIGRGLAALRYPDCNKYIFYYFRLIENKLDELGTGSTFKAISRKTLNDFEISLPPLSEQKKIVGKIEELFSDLENGVASFKKAKEQIKLYRQSVLASAFNGKLIGNGNIDKKNGLPKGWEWVKNKDLLKYVTSGSRDWKKYYSSSGARFIRTQDINTNKLNLENTAYVNLPEKVEGKRSLVEEGDLLMTITGANVGKVAIVDFPIKEAYVSQSVALLKYLDKKITKYLWYYFQAPDFGKTFIEKLVYGMGRPVLSLENMREVKVIICPYEQQKLIISEIEMRYSEADNLEKALDESLTKAEALRQSILKKAFEGRLIQPSKNKQN